MTRHSVENIAVFGTTLLLSILALWVVPVLHQEDSDLYRVAGVLVASVSAGFLYKLLSLFLHRVRVRKLLGAWFYVTHPHDPELWETKRRFGLMEFFVKPGGNLQYRVRLFREADALLEAAERGFSTLGAYGTARSEAISYEDDEELLHILYAVKMFDDEKNREGVLVLDTSNAPRRLHGNWHSKKPTSPPVLSAGRLDAARLEYFPDILQQYMPES